MPNDVATFFLHPWVYVNIFNILSLVPAAGSAKV